MVNAVKCPGVFPNDERDRIVTKFNMIQASAGTGMGLVNYGGQITPVDFSSDNLLCRFKVCWFDRKRVEGGGGGGEREREREKETRRRREHIKHPQPWLNNHIHILHFCSTFS